MNTVTKIVISDPELMAQLSAVSGRIIFESPAGDPVKTVETVPFGKLPPGVKSPVSDSEFEEARKSPDSGIPLEEFWKQVERGEWR